MIAEEIADKLETEGLGTVGTDIFIGHLPDTPNNAVVVIDTFGDAPDPSLPIENPRFQVLVRNTAYSTGRAKLDAIMTALHKLANVTLGSTYVYAVLANSGGGHIGRDEAGRDEFSMNFRARTR